MGRKKLLFTEEDIMEIEKFRKLFSDVEIDENELDSAYAGACGAQCMVTCANYCDDQCESTCSESCSGACETTCTHSCEGYPCGLR